MSYIEDCTSCGKRAELVPSRVLYEAYVCLPCRRRENERFAELDAMADRLHSEQKAAGLL